MSQNRYRLQFILQYMHLRVLTVYVPKKILGNKGTYMGLG